MATISIKDPKLIGIYSEGFAAGVEAAAKWHEDQARENREIAEEIAPFDETVRVLRDSAKDHDEFAAEIRKLAVEP